MTVWVLLSLLKPLCYIWRGFNRDNV